MNDGPTLEISTESAFWLQLPNVAELAEAAIAEAIRRSRVQLLPGAEISLLLCDDSFIRTLNLRWRGRDEPTNVLSFPGPGEIETTLALGDIAIAFETTAREAEEQGKTFEDHFAHLLVHGFLHLIGHDHQNEAEAAAMEQLERDILAGLGIDDPHASTSAGIAE